MSNQKKIPDFRIKVSAYELIHCSFQSDIFQETEQEQLHEEESG